MENESPETLETFTARLGSGPALKVHISDCHNGQIVTPVVLARRAGRERCKVVLSWFDASDRTYYEATEFTGTIIAAEKWIIKQGVRLDAQGIY